MAGRGTEGAEVMGISGASGGPEAATQVQRPQGTQAPLTRSPRIPLQNSLNPVSLSFPPKVLPLPFLRPSLGGGP